MGETDHRPLALYLLQSTQEKLPKTARLFDLSKHRLNHGFASGIDGRAHFGLQFSSHAVYPRSSFRQRPSPARLLPIPIRLSIYRHEPFDLFLLQIVQIRIRTISAVTHYFRRLLPGLLSDHLDHRPHLLFVIGVLGHQLAYDQLQLGLYRDLRVIGLHKTVRPLHDARFRIGKVVLHLGLGLHLCLGLALALGLLARPLFQGSLGFANLLQSGLSPRQLRRQLIAAPIPPIASILFCVYFLCLFQQPFYLRPQSLFVLLHPPVAHGLVLARIGFHLAAIQHHSPQLHRPRLQRDLPAPGQTTLAAPTDAACENPRWFGNPVHCPPPASGSPHLPLTFSGSAARKILPRSSRRAKSWSSCADGMEADLAPLFHRPTRSRSDPADRPHPRQNAPSDSPATNRAGSAATVNLVQEGKPGKLSPCCQTGISFL